MSSLKRKAEVLILGKGNGTHDVQKRQRITHASSDNNYDPFKRQDWGLSGNLEEFFDAGTQLEVSSDIFDGLQDEELEALSANTTLPFAKEPPASVLRHHDRSSRSADEFDPKLQYSTPLTSPQSAKGLCNQPANILETDVDWEPVREHSRPTTTSGANGVPRRPLESSSPDTITASTDQLPAYVKLKPFKTFLHIQDLVDAKNRIFRNSKNTSFELFARVVYSSRENFTRKQYFQFRSLLGLTPPYLLGTLKDWAASPLTEKTLEDFINQRSIHGMKCYCECQLIQDARSEIGWSAVVTDIRSISWKEICAIVDHLGLKDLDHRPAPV